MTGELAVVVDRELADVAEAAVRGHWTVFDPLDGHAIATELCGTLDRRTGALRLNGTLVAFGDWSESHRPLPVPAETAPPDPGAPTPFFGLTSREIDVARLLARGDSNAAIGRTLGISPHTARRHTESVMLKLGAHARAQVGAILRGDVVTARGATDGGQLLRRAAPIAGVPADR